MVILKLFFKDATDLDDVYENIKKCSINKEYKILIALMI